MTPNNEPTMQVPVSMIEELRAWAQTARVAKVGGIGNLYSIIRDIEALPSQSTPTAEPLRLCTDEDVKAAQALLDQARAEAEPPRPEDMAPGTTFRAAIIDSTMWNTFEVLVDVGDGFSLRERATGHYWKPSAIDPSTIRDVTPPR